jgi:rod shape-determining protein MreD
MGGLAQDFLSGYYLGMNTLSLTVIGYLVGLGHTRLFRENQFVLAGIAFLATLAVEAIRYLLILSLGITVLPGEALWGLILPLGVYNAAVALLFYRRFYLSATEGILRIP